MSYRQAAVKTVTKPFDPEATCPKCGYDKVLTHFCPDAAPAELCWPYIDEEHMHRECDRCQFEWLEKTNA